MARNHQDEYQRPERPERPDRPERPERHEYPDRPERPDRPEDIPDCEEKDNATQVDINQRKAVFCDNLYNGRHQIKKLEVIYKSKNKIYKRKEEQFLDIRENYNRYVNTEIGMGSQLMEANVRLTTNVTNYKTWDDSLSTTLKGLFDKIKDVKQKMKDLREAAFALEHSQNDSCSTAQWALITGKNPDKCREDDEPEHPHHHHTHACKDIDDVIDLLICMPKALFSDMDSIFKASSDVIGIQKFCNVGGLVSLQTTLSVRTKEFDDLLNTVIKTRKTDLDTAQKDLVLSLKERTDSVIDVYNQRCDYSGVYKTVEEICCPKCRCVDSDAGNCIPRLEDCECEICEICKEVRNAFTNSDTTTTTPAATTTPTPATP